MLDIQLLRNDLADVVARLKTAWLSARWRRVRIELEARAQGRYRCAPRSCRRGATPSRKQIGIAKSRGEDAIGAAGAKSPVIGDELTSLEAQARWRAAARCATGCSAMPNLPHASVPVGTLGSRQRRDPPLGQPEDVRLSRRAITSTSATAVGGLDFDASAKTFRRAVSIRCAATVARLHRRARAVDARYARPSTATPNATCRMSSMPTRWSAPAQLPKFEDDLFWRRRAAAHRTRRRCT